MPGHFERLVEFCRTNPIGVAGKYYVPKMGPFVIYTIMIVILIWRPNGLFGRSATHTP